MIQDPVGGKGDLSRSAKGGYWSNHIKWLRSARRINPIPNQTISSLGFRMAISIDPVGGSGEYLKTAKGGRFLVEGNYSKSSKRISMHPDIAVDTGVAGFRMAITTDPVGAKEDTHRVVKGSACPDSLNDSSGSSTRTYLSYGFVNFDLGFRISANMKDIQDMNTSTILEAIHLSSSDDVAWMAFADFLEEQGLAEQAELFRITWMGCQSCGPSISELEALAQRQQDILNKGVVPIMPSFTNSVGMTFVLIPPGVFLMGSPETEKERFSDEQLHAVEITKPFYMAIHQTTQEQYEAVMGVNPSHFKLGPTHPVESVSWNDATELCKKLSEKEGISYRLPSEAEWEYSCRGGSPVYQVFNFGNSLSSHQANFNGNYPYGDAEKGPYLQHTTPVGSYRCNAFGLYDMHGNVWEWCQDWYASDYGGIPREIEKEGRGGGYEDSVRYVRTSCRGGMTSPGRTADVTGFRVSADPNGGTGPEDDNFKMLKGGSEDEGHRYMRTPHRAFDYPGAALSTIGFRIASAVNPVRADIGDHKTEKGGGPLQSAAGVRSAHLCINPPDSHGASTGFRLVATTVDPKGGEEGAKTFRGGALHEFVRSCRSSQRFNTVPEYFSASVGFRVIMELVSGTLPSGWSWNPNPASL